MTTNEFDTTENFVFSALRGIQAEREYYVVMCPLKLIPKLFLFNESEIPAEIRAQRTLNKARIPEIASYVINNRSDYIFSAITASIDGDVRFQPIEESGLNSKVGTLFISMDSRFLVNDGQHRRAAIEHAIQQNPDLCSETICVVFYLDKGLKKSQQMFSDLNKHAVRPTTSLNILYDHRDPFSNTLVSILNEIPIFSHELTELEKTSISNRAHKVFTLNSIHHATRALLGKKEKKGTINNEEKLLIIDFWNSIFENIVEWQEVIRGNVTPYDLREKYVHIYGILLHALGIMGHDLIIEYPDSWKSKLKFLRKIDWSRNNVDWEGRAIVLGKLSKSHTSIVLTSNYLKKKAGLKLSDKEEDAEKIFWGD